MTTGGRSVSVPELTVVSADGQDIEPIDDVGHLDEDQRYIHDTTSSIISPLTPKLTPTFR